MKTITLKEAANRLGYDDPKLRVITSWCIKNQVFIDKQTKPYTIYEPEFETTRLKGFIQHLQKKHGENWEEFYYSYKQDKPPDLNSLNQSKPTNIITKSALKKSSKKLNDYKLKLKSHVEEQN